MFKFLALGPLLSLNIGCLCSDAGADSKKDATTEDIKRQEMLEAEFDLLCKAGLKHLAPSSMIKELKNAKRE